MSENSCGCTHGYSLEKDKTKQRQSNIELLRIICMIIIIMSHYPYFGIKLTNDININNLILHIFRITHTRSERICNNYGIFYD